MSNPRRRAYRFSCTCCGAEVTGWLNGPIIIALPTVERDGFGIHEPDEDEAQRDMLCAKCGDIKEDEGAGLGAAGRVVDWNAPKVRAVASRSVMKRIEIQSRRGVPGSEVFLVCCGGAPLHAFAMEEDARDFIVSKAEALALLDGTPSIVRMEVK